jgi:NitT/TauT family transport system ATP-binding protein
MVEFEGITYGYPQQLPIFESFTWQVGKGETWAVLGPSGCGKTTLLYLLAGLRFPSRGQILIHGERVLRPRPETGLILQDYGLLPWATVEENATLGFKIREFYGPDGTHAPQKYLKGVDFTQSVGSWLKRVGIDAVAQQFPRQLSGGQRQRTGIARTLVLGPDLLLMDEPFSSLDAPTREGLQNLTLELCAEEGITLILVTHSIEEAAYLGKKILLLNRPPNRYATVLTNPGAGGPAYRDSPGYIALCRDLRERLEAT